MTTDEMIRGKFDALQTKKAAVQAKSAPLHKLRAANRAKQDKLIAEENGIVAKIKAAEAGMYETDMEISKLAGILPGNHRRISEAP